MHRRRPFTSAMHVDLLTLYFLIVGTLFASSGMTLWEHRIHPLRSKELKTLAAGYATLAIGCAAATVRYTAPGGGGPRLNHPFYLPGLSPVSARRRAPEREAIP